MGNCLETLSFIWDNINKRTGCSFDTLNELNNDGKLARIFNDYNVDMLLKQELDNFLYLLFSDKYDNFPYIRKLELNESNFIKIFTRFAYIIGLVYGNKESYRVLPVFLKTLFTRFNMDYYKYLSVEQIDEILRNRMSLHDLNSNRDLIELD